METYIKECNVYFASKVVCHRPYRDLLLVLVPIYYEKDFLMNFVIGLPLFAN